MVELNYTIERRPRRKTASISVAPDNGVTVIVPQHLTDGQVQEIVDRKINWIRSKIRVNSEVKYPYRRREYVSGEEFIYLGRHYRLKVVEGDAAAVKLENGWLYVPVPSSIAAQDRDEYILSELTLWYQSRGLRKLKERVSIFARRLGLNPKNVISKELRRQWGSCTKYGDLAFNWKVVIAPISIIDYVVAHELCHLVHHDHSKEYWRLLEAVMPDYKERKEWLRVNGSLLTLR